MARNRGGFVRRASRFDQTNRRHLPKAVRGAIRQSRLDAPILKSISEARGAVFAASGVAGAARAEFES